MSELVEAGDDDNNDNDEDDDADDGYDDMTSDVDLASSPRLRTR